MRREWLLLLGLALIGAAAMAVRIWVIPERGKPYEPFLRDAESRNRLPVNLLARMAWQESRFRDDIVSGATPSSAGALGIMQIVPRYHPGVDPLNPTEAIYYAGKHVRDLFDQLGSWARAVAAYHSGAGTVSRTIRERGADWVNGLGPRGQAYVNEIMGDVPNAGPIV